MSNKDLKHYAYYLFARPTFLEGMGRIFDFRNRLEQYNESQTAEEADRKATQLDWLAVGQDLKNAFNQYGQQQPS